MRIAVYDPRLPRLLNNAQGNLGTAVQLAVALSSAGCSLEILHEGELNKDAFFQHIEFDLPNVKLLSVTPSDVGMTGITSHYDIFINASDDRFIRSRASAAYWFYPFPSRPSLGLNTNNANQALQSYRHIVACSQYARHWFKHSWHVDAVVLPPLVRPIVPDYPRRQVIASVGNFFAGHNNKKQGALINAFCEMVDDGLKNWELHLIGHLDLSKDEDRNYFNRLDVLVGDYPVFIHMNVPQQDLLNIISHAAIYWDAAGFDEDLKRHPTWVAPFDTALVEAMSAGSAPVVFDAGSHTEIVQEGHNGLLWNTLEELQVKTLRLIHDPYPRELLYQAAIQTSQSYCDVGAFADRVCKLIGL